MVVDKPDNYFNRQHPVPSARKTTIKQLRLERDGYSNIIFISRYSVIRLSRLVWDQEAVGSNPAISTKASLAQLVEHVTVNDGVGGS